MRTKTIVTAKSLGLTVKVTEIRKIITQFERHRDSNEAFKVTLGKALIALKAEFEAQMSSKRAGFTAWAAKQFKRTSKTIEQYMRYARNPAALERDKRVYEFNPLKRCESAYQRLSAEDKKTFLVWLDKKLSEDDDMVRMKPFATRVSPPQDYTRV